MLLTAFSILMLLVSCSPQNPGVSKPASCEDDPAVRGAPLAGWRLLDSIWEG